MLPLLTPQPLASRARPFDHPDWYFELKYDGFRALAYVRRGRCQLVSRNGHLFASFAELAAQIGTEVEGTAIIDGELVCMDEKGRPQFKHLLFRRRLPCLVAFDLLFRDGKDLRHDSLLDRKQALRALLCGTRVHSVRYADHVEGEGKSLFRRVCELDLEGIVAKHKGAPYLAESSLSTWYKIRNPNYSQMVGRHKLFERERHQEPVPGWHSCTLACGAE